MANVIRIFVEKREGFDVEARQMLADLRDNLGMTQLRALRILNRYDVEGLSASEFARARGVVFSEPNADVVYDETLPLEPGWQVFAMEYLPGQYDQRADFGRPVCSAPHPGGTAPGAHRPGDLPERGAVSGGCGADPAVSGQSGGIPAGLP